MHFNLFSTPSKILCDRIILLIVRRHASSTTEPSITAAKATPRKLLVRFVEERRRKIQMDDIRLEPYLSKGVYTESGAIRPVNQSSNKLFNCFLVQFRCLNDIPWE